MYSSIGPSMCLVTYRNMTCGASGRSLRIGPRHDLAAELVGFTSAEGDAHQNAPNKLLLSFNFDVTTKHEMLISWLLSFSFG